MTNAILNIDNGLWLLKSWLLENGISKETIKKWLQANNVSFKKIKKHLYFSYDSIPTTTRKRLPSRDELINLTSNSAAISYYKQLVKAIAQKEIQYRNEIKADAEIPKNLVELFAKRAAALDFAIHTDKRGNGKLISLHDAFTKVFPNWIKNHKVLDNILRKARFEGVTKAAIDTRMYNGHCYTKYDVGVKHCAATLYSIGKAYTPEQVQNELEKEYKRVPNVRTIQYWFNDFERNSELFEARYGNSKYFGGVEPYISTIAAENANVQWQADGVDLPFYAKGYQRLTLFYVLDAYSRKIIGYSIGESENTVMILQAFNDAITNTGGIGFEIKMDNHSYNRTLEGQNFKEDTQKLFHTVWNISHNPRHKSLIERTNKTLNDKFFKLHKGYIGQGVKSREKNAHTSPELLTKYQKANHWLAMDEIRVIATLSIDKYNNTALKSSGKSPFDLYANCDKPYKSEVSLYERVQLFVKKTELKVTRGQLNITRGGVKYEYQLNAELFAKCNGLTVGVRYEDLDTIYLFDKKKDTYLGCINQKPKVHGAVYEQTPEDLQILMKHKGRLQGIKSQARKQNEALTKAAQEINPDAFGRLNELTTPKDVLKAVQQNHALKARAEDLGVDFNRAERGLPVEEVVLQSLKAKEPLKNKSPFSSKNHTPSIYKPLNN